MTIVLVLIAGVYVLAKSGLLDNVIALADRKDAKPSEPDEVA